MCTYGRRFVADCTDASLDVVALLLADVRVLRGFLEAEPEPEGVPDEADEAVEVEGRLPAEVRREHARHGQPDDGARVGAAEGQSGEPTPLHGRRPVAPDSVARGIGDALQAGRGRVSRDRLAGRQSNSRRGRGAALPATSGERRRARTSKDSLALTSRANPASQLLYMGAYSGL